MNRKQAFTRAGVSATAAALSIFAMGALRAQDATPETTPDATREAGAQATPDTAPEVAETRRTFLGVQIGDTDEGIIVAAVQPGSPAAAAGIQPEDLITAINGEPVGNAQALSDAIAALQPGDAITLQITRGGESQTLDATLGEIVERDVTRGGQGGRGNRGGDNPGFPFGQFGERLPFDGQFFLQNGRLGVAFISLDEDAAAENQVELTEGALVTEVQENSPAFEAGIQVGDVVTAVNGEPVDVERTLRDRLIAYEPGDVVTLSIVREGETQDVEVTLGQPEIGGGMFFQFSPDDLENLPPGFLPDDLLPESTEEAPAPDSANA